jgi:hypothetical protein
MGKQEKPKTYQKLPMSTKLHKGQLPGEALEDDFRISSEKVEHGSQMISCTLPINLVLPSSWAATKRMVSMTRKSHMQPIMLTPTSAV